MALSEGEDLRMIKKFRSDNFYYWKKKIDLLLTSLDLWNIVDESEELSSDDAHVNMKKKYKICKKKAFDMMALNLDDANFSHVILVIDEQKHKDLATSMRIESCSNSIIRQVWM